QHRSIEQKEKQVGRNLCKQNWPLSDFKDPVYSRRGRHWPLFGPLDKFNFSLLEKYLGNLGCNELDFKNKREQKKWLKKLNRENGSRKRKLKSEKGYKPREKKSHSGSFTTACDAAGMPSDYPAYSSARPARHDNSAHPSPRTEFEYFVL